MNKEAENNPERPRRRKGLRLVLGGLAIGAGLGLMTGTEDYASDAAGALILTGGIAELLVAVAPRDEADAGQQR